jgi:hypothetical protein
VAEVAGYGGFIGFVAVDAGFHFHRKKCGGGVLAPHFAVAGFTGYFRGGVICVAEKYEIREDVNRFFGRDFRVFRQVERGVARLAFLGFWEGRALRRFGSGVAGDALQFQGRVARVAELDWRAAQG